MIKKILLLASLFFTLISFSQKIDASLEHLREGESVMMERTMPLPLGQRPSGFTQSDIDKSSAGMDLTLRGNMTFIGNNNLSVDVKKTRDFRELNKAFDLYRYPYILNNGSVYTGNETPNDSYDLDLYIYQNGNIRQDLGNGSAYMDYVDVDGSVDENGDGKDDTFSSSTSTLSLPNCSRVAYAGLYWAGVYPREHWLTTTNPLRSDDYDKIKFKYPSSTTYKNITADETIYNNNEPYICFKDITTEVQAEVNPNGVYTAANIRATRGVDHYRGLGGASGWVMIVVYENDNESSKKFSVFDGFADIHGETKDASGNVITPANEAEITFLNFKTIPKGPVNVELIMAALEGDKAIPGDNYQIKNAANNYVNVFNTISPQDNFFNGSISVFDTYLAGRNPASTNTLGFDIDHIKINNPNNSIIGNNETSLDVKFTTGGDVYWPFLNAMSVEVVEPEIKLVKTAVDATNTPITSEVALGGEVYYNITFQNIGTDNAKNTVIVDELKTTVDFKDIPGNIEVSDSRISYTYEASTTLNGGGGKLTFTVPDDLVKINGAEYTIKIKVNATSDCSKLRDACSNKVKNQAFATYERDESKLDASNPGYVPGYNTLTTASYAGLEPTCNLGVQGTTNFVIDTSNCKGSIQLLCGGDVELSAGAGFDSYEWINIAKPAIVLATTQNYKAIEAGTYQVTAIAPSGCTDRIETIEVIGDNLATNPLEPFADQILTSCTSNTEELAEIYLCGTGVSKTINLPFGASLATTVKWFKLDETKPCDPTKPTELPTTTSNCANIATGCSWDEIGTKTGRELSKEFSQKGQYKLEVLYDGQCPKTYYFNVFSGALNPTFNKKHIVCGANGSIIVNGVPSGYEYKLTAPSGNTIPVNGFQNSNEFKNLSEVGNYDITIKLKGSTLASCSFDYIVKIDEQALGLTVAPEFNAGCDGKAIITAQVNGTLPGDYIYTLLNSVGGVIETKAATPDRSVTFEVTNAGLYSVKVATTTTTCTETVTTRVIKPTPLTLTAVATKNITCTAGSSDGIITLAGANGVPNTTGDKYSYALLSINGVAVSPKTYFTDTTYNVVNGTEGDYIFEVTDNKNCTATATATISVEAPLQFTHKETQVNCNKKGAITVKITDTLGYALEYSLDNATWKTTGFFDGLDATTAATLYTVYIRATKGTYQCNYQIQNIAITETGGLTDGSAVATGLSCGTQNNPEGKIKFTAPTGGTIPYTYFYKHSSDTNFTSVTSGTVAIVLKEGTYTTKVEDKNGCSLPLDTVTIDALPTEPNLSSEVLLCGTTGTVIIMPNDSSYKYSIDGTNFQTSNVFENVAIGSHTFTVKYGLFCSRTIDVNVSGQPFSGSIMSQTDSDCSGSDNGTITINASGFQGGSYEYSIDGGTTWEETGDNPYRIVGLEAKEHHLKIREVIGTAPNQLTCKINLGKRIIGEPTELKLINTGVTTPATCTTGGTITVEASGGTPPYKFSIDGGASWQNANTSNQYVYANVAVSATKYQVMLLDSRKCDECGCTDNPFENGSFEDRYFRGYYPYIADESNFTGWETTAADNKMELWYKNNYQNVPSYDGSDNFVELNANTVGSLYQEFCTKSGDVINWSVAHRGRLGRDVATVKIGKSLASATIEKTMSDGKTWKEYSGAYTVPAGQTTTVISFDAVSTFTGDKSTGNFIDAVKIDINRLKCDIKEVEVKAPANATHTATVTDSCTDPKIEITATGTAPYQFSIDNGATWQTSNNATFVFDTTNGLALPTTTAKDYQVKTKNGGGCESPVSTLTVYPKLTATVTPTPESCKKGFFTITDVKGGNITTTNYVYAVVLKDATPTNTDFKPITSPSTKSGGLSAGNYDIYIRDNGGNAGFCEYKETEGLYKRVPAFANTKIPPIQPKCFGEKGTIYFSIGGNGLAPFTYTLNGLNPKVIDDYVYYTIDNLDPGKYVIEITDANGCTHKLTQEIFKAPEKLEKDADATPIHFTCKAVTAKGGINFMNPTGGTKPYTFYYKVKDPSVVNYSVVTGNIATGLLEGTYVTKVVDANKCEINLNDVTIKPLPTAPTLIESVAYNCDGKGTITVKPFDASYTYSLDGATPQTGANPNVFTNLSVGNHTVSVNYGSDCTTDVIVEVKAGQNFTAVASFVENPKCKDGTDGKIKVVASFGLVTVDKFQYSIDDGNNWIDVINSDEVVIDTFGAGNHIIKVKNATGCEVDSNAITLTAPTSAVIVNPSTKTLTKEITCNPNTGATITPSASGGNGAPYAFELFDSLNNPVALFTGLSAGTYSVVAKDKLGCKSVPFEVIIADKKDVEFTATPSVCHTGSNASIELTDIKGNNDFTFSVHNGTSIIRTGSVTGTAQTISGLSEGTYKVTVTDGFGCSETEDVTIKQQLTVSATTTQQTCKDGILDITASGGKDTNYVYAVVISGAGVPADTSFSATAPTTITAGTWDIYVRDNGGTGTLGTDYCQAFTTNKVTKIPNPTIDTVTAIQPKCFGEKGTINVTVSGGTTDYTVTLTGLLGTTSVQPQTGNSLNYEFKDLVADTYTIKVTDVNTCASAEKTQEIKVPSVLKDGKAVSTDLACGVSGGSITFTNPTGGTPDPVTGNYTFYYKLTTDANFTPVLGNNTNTVTVTNLSAGDYLTKVVDSEGCSLDLNTVTNPITIKALPTVPTFDVPVITYNCEGKGNITVTPTVAPTPATAYSYMLDKDKTTTNNTGVFTAVTPGSHTVSVDYGSNCSTDVIVEVKDNQQFTASITGQTNPVCKDEANGKIEVTASFGSVAVTEFQYSTDGTTWKDANTNPFTIDGFNAGTTAHTINVRPTGKTSPSACDVTLTKILTNPTAVEVTGESHTKITCTSTTSTITPTVKGGNGGAYTYTVESLDNSGNSLSPKVISSTLTGLSAGKYNVVAKDKLGCESIAFPITIADKEDVEFTATASACHTGNDASITLDVTKGNGTYSFALTDVATTLITKTGNITGTSHTIPNLSAGTYTVTVTDGFGCSKKSTDIIINAKITATLNTTQANCNNGSLIIANVAGASGTDYVYAVVAEGSPVPTTFTAITNPLLTTVSLSKEKYDVYIRDNSGNAGYCQYKETKEITKIPDLTATAKTIIQPNCFGETGSLVFEISGGKPTYTYTLNGAAVPATATVTVVGNTHTIAGLVADDYDIIVKDANSCTVTIPTQTIKAPDTLENGLATSIHFTCKTLKGGIDFVNPNGGTGVYTFSYKLDTAPVTAFMPVVGNQQLGLDAGTYNIKVKDANNCEIPLNDVTINPLPAAPTLTESVAYNCDGKGTITVTATPSAVLPIIYTYSLDGATPQTGANPNVFADLDAGSYTVSVGYGSDCFTDIDVIVANDKKFGASVTKTVNPTCFGASDGSITIEAVNATEFQYSINGAIPIVVNSSNKVTISNLEAKTHTIKVSPIGITTGICVIELSKELTNPLKVEVTAIVEQEITCNPNIGATIQVTPKNGIAPYTYTIEYLDDLGNSLPTPKIETSLTNLPAGKYKIVATDSKLCKSDAFEIEVEAKIDVSFDAKALCYDGSNGTIEVTNILGNGKLKYTVNGGAETNVPTATPTSFTVIGLSAGVHKIKIIDERGCSLEKTITIYPELSATATPTNLSCTPAGTPTGQILVVPSGGTGFVTPTDYQFSVVTANATAPAAGTYLTTNLITGLAAGTYDVYVKDAQNCEYIVEDVLIKTITPVKITTTANQPQCNGNKGSIDGEITANTGQAPFTITLKDSAGITAGTTLETLTITGTTFSFNNLVDETYTIEITDALGCKFTETETLTSPIALVIDIKDVLPTDCVDTDPAKIGFDFENVNAAVYLPNKLQYTIDNGATWIDYTTTGGQVRNLASGELVYIGLRTIDSTNAVVCSIFKGTNYEISYNLEGLIVNPVVGPAGCSTGFNVTVEAVGGNAPYKFAIGTPTTWLDAGLDILTGTTRVFSSLTPGLTYEFFVKDATGCIKKNNEDVYENFKSPVVIKPTVDKEVCFGAVNTGEITFNLDDPKNITNNVLSNILNDDFKWTLFKKDLTTATGTAVTGYKDMSQKTLDNIIVTGLDVGTYYIVLTTNTATACQFGSLDVDIKQGTEITGNLKNIKDITCASPGQIRIENVTGGFGDYTYTATATEGVTPIIINNIVSVPFPTVIPPATIPATVEVTITVTDKNQCSFELPKATLTVSQSPTINPVTVNSCGAVNTIDINTTGGLAPYQYSLDGINFQAPVSTADHTMNVVDGNQTLTVKDANGCIATATFNVYPDITFDIDNITVPDCNTSNNSADNATATITVNTGSGNYQYSLDGVLPAVDIIGTTVTFPTTLTPGNHTIKIIDKLNATCTLEKTFTVSEPIKPSFTASITKNNSCFGSNGGEITITPTINGAEPLTFTVLNTTTNVTLPTKTVSTADPVIFDNLSAGEYEITAKGTNNGCEFTYPITPDKLEIIVFDPIIVPATAISVTEFACNTGTNTTNQAIVKVNKLPKFGGSGTYTGVKFEFTPNGGGAVETQAASSSFEFTTDNILGGKVDITVFDDKGCSGTTTTAIIEPFVPIADLLAKPTKAITCSANESIEVTFTGTATEIKVEQIPTIGTGYSQTKTPVSPATTVPSGTEFANLPVGKYTITIKNDKGCELTTSYTVKEIPAYTILLSDKVPTTCVGSSTGSIKIDVDNYTGNYDYTITETILGTVKTGTGISGEKEIKGLKAGKYKIKITIGNAPAIQNCSVTEKEFEIIDAPAVLSVKAEETSAVQCIDDANATITVTETKGGWGDYEYQLEIKDAIGTNYTVVKDALSNDINFTTNGNNKIFTGLSHGTYKVKVKDALGCISEITDAIIITNPTEVKFTVTKDDTVCDVNIAGSITVDLKDAVSGLAGGKAPYTYTLTDDASTPNVKTVTITDTEYTFTGLSKANYTVSVKDDNLCKGTGIADIKIFDDIVFTLEETKKIDCSVSTDAVYNINVSGGSGSFTYEIKKGTDVEIPAGTILTNTTTFTTSVAGDYTITITDTGATPNCTKTSNFTVQESVKPEFTVDATKTGICFGTATGVISITSETQNGINDLTYTISPNINNVIPYTGTFNTTTKSFENLPAGFYTITGKGTNDCTFTYPDEIEIEQLDEVKIGLDAIKDIEYSCSPEIPMATITVDKDSISGGNLNKNYNVAFEFTPTSGTGKTQPASSNFKFTTTNTSGGKVKITVSDDQGCSSAEKEVTIPAFAPILDLEIIDITKITCTTDESIKVSFTGDVKEIKVEQILTIGTGYSQTKNPVSPATSLTSPIEFTGLPVGNYTISVTDAVTGCDATTFHTVEAAPVYNAVITNPVNVSCKGGTGTAILNIQETGLALPYTGAYNYEVLDESKNSFNPPIKVTGVNGEQTISNLKAGKYTVQITMTASPDCSPISKVFEIKEPTDDLSVTGTPTKVSCIGQEDGTITAIAIGGWKNYEYELEYSSDLGITYNTAKDASSNDINFANNGSNNIFKNLPEGTYKVSVKDALGCVFESVEVEVKNPDAVTFTVSKDDTICNNAIGGEITVTGSGGTGTYTYTLTDDSNPVKVTTQTGVTGDYTFTNLPAAVYTVSVTDTNNCVGTVDPTSINPITIFENIDFPTPTSTDLLTCVSTDEVTFNIIASGGSGTFTYGIVKTGSINTYTISRATTPPTFKTNEAGTYTVTITDTGAIGNCLNPITRTFTVNEPAQPDFNPKATTNNICFGSSDGVITVNEVFIAEVNPVTYTISLNGGTLTSAQGNFNTTTSSFENLPVGTYTITGTGDNKCPTSKDVKIEQLDKVTIGANAIQNVTYICDVANPKATITVDKTDIKGGNGDVNKNYNVEFIFTPTGGASEAPILDSTFTTDNVLGGTVEIKVTDDQGCDSDIKTVTIPAFTPILPSDIQISHTPTCEFDKQSVTVKLDNLDASIAPVIFIEITKLDGSILSKKLPRPQDGSGVVFDKLPLGDYEVSITHPITNCIITKTYTIKEPVYNVLYSDVENTTCVGSATGSVVIDIQKGNSQEFYTGKYEYEVLDSVGNSLTPSPIKANVQPTTLTTNPLKILGLKAGSYVVKITDIDNARACSFTSAVFKIEDAPAGELKVTAEISSEITCNNDNNATITATATGGWGSNYEYQLEDNLGNTITVKDALGADVIYDFANNKGNNIFKNLPEGTYKVQVKDILGCDNVYSKEQIIVNPKPVTFKTEMIANICSDTKPAITVTAQGGSGEYIYTLKDSGAGNEESIRTTSLTHTFDNLSVNNNENYTVSVNDVKGCVGTPETVNADVVTVYPELEFYLTPDKLSCQSDGTTTENAVYKINVTGGSGDFDYSVVDKNDVNNIVAVTTGTNPPTFSIADAGTYILKITDNKAEITCNSIESEDIVVGEPIKPAFEPQILVNNICFGSSDGVIYIPNGANPLTYTINSNPVIGFNSTTNKFEGLSAGTYTITGKGTNSCTTTKDVTIVEKSEIKINPDDIKDKITVTDFTCTTGNTTNTASVKIDKEAILGGIAGTTKPNFNRVVFVYDNGTTDTADDIKQDSESFDFFIYDENNNTSGGKVAITIYDAQNCSSAKTTIIKTIKGFEKITDATITQTQKLDCSNKETITVKANLDIANLTYTITGTAKSSNYTDTKTIVSTTDFAKFENLEADSYTITIKNPDTGCVFTTGYVVKDAPTFNIKIGETRRTCFDATGIATATVTLDIETIIAAADYIGNYTYEVVDKTGTSLTAPITGTGIGGTQNIISGLIAGTYKVKVTMTDSPECEVLSEEFSITSQPKLNLKENSIVNYISCNSSEGSVILKADGGWGNYEYQLEKTKNNITTIEQAFGKNSKFDTLEEGSYTATVRDINNCEATLSFVLVKGIKLTAETKVNKNVCEGEQNASIEIINVTGGQIQDAGVTYSYILKYPTELGGLEVEQSSNIFDGLLAGNYQVRVIDNKYGCNTGNFEKVKVTIEDPIKVEASANITKDITCDITTASVKVTAKGGKAPYEFSIDGITYNPSNTST
ncbi:SprB repeat-containing protein, partial [Tenacibaculum piscium]